MVLLAVLLLTEGSRGQRNVIHFDGLDEEFIVKSHNDLRRSIYNAANMRELTWNEAVAHAASEWAEQCQYVSRPDNQWGQNMFYFHGHDYHKSPKEMFSHSFRQWFNETMHYDYRRFRQCGSKHVCSYVQLIAADVQQVGCAIVKCPRLQFQDPYGEQTHAKLLVCFYTPWVNILDKEVFIPEKRCSACPLGTVCVDNLCSARFHDIGGRQLNLVSPIIKIGVEHQKRPSAVSSSDVTIKDKISETKQETRRQGNRSRGRHNRRNRHKKPDINMPEKIYPDSNEEGKEIVVLGEHRQNPESFLKSEDNQTIVVFTNNRVVPFPGRKENKDIRKIERILSREEGRPLRHKTLELVKTEEEIRRENNVTLEQSATHTRKKRQTYLYTYEELLHRRQLEYNRLLRERQRQIQEIEAQRRRLEEERRRRDHEERVQEELRRYSHSQRLQYEEELQRRRKVRDERRRLQAMALIANTGDITGEEQFYTISAHNVLRRQVGARDLAWSSHLERWAKYVIRCETEYPGPINCYTNFGKADLDQEIYNVVYEWGHEGDDLRRPLRYGCRTPYDKSLCNHNSIILNRSLTQMACAAKYCGDQRQLTCIYNSN